MPCTFRRHLNQAHALLACSTVFVLGACSDGAGYSDLHPAERLEVGLDYLQMFDFDTANDVLSGLDDELPVDSEQWALATYALSLTFWHRSPASASALAEAEALLQAVVEHAPGTELAASALLDLGRIAEASDYLEDTVDVEKARDYYQRVRKAFPRTEMAARATLFLAQTYADRFDHEEAVGEAIRLLEAEMAAQPDSPWMGTMAQYLAQLRAFYEEDLNSALKPYGQAMREGFPRSAETDQSLWQYGLMAQEAGEEVLAAHLFSRLVDNYPRSAYGTVARERVIEIAGAHPEAGIVIPAKPSIGIGR